MYNFLLMINSNLGPILLHFWDTVTYWLKITIFSYPLSFSALAQGDPFLIYGKALQILQLGLPCSWQQRFVDPSLHHFGLIHPCSGQRELRWIRRARAVPAIMRKNRSTGTWQKYGQNLVAYFSLACPVAAMLALPTGESTLLTRRSSLLSKASVALELMSLSAADISPTTSAATGTHLSNAKSVAEMFSTDTDAAFDWLPTKDWLKVRSQSATKPLQQQSQIHTHWWCGVAITHFIRSTKLLCGGPSY